MMSLSQEQIQEVLKGIVWSEWPLRPKGGQNVNNGWPRGVKASHPDWGFEVACCEHRTQAGNKETCLLLFELWLGSL